VTGQWFFPGTPSSSINKTDHHDINEILLKVTLITLTPYYVLIFISIPIYVFTKDKKNRYIYNNFCLISTEKIPNFNIP